jgi:hypothetical protein
LGNNSAKNFALHDLDNDGIPEILIYYSGETHSMFRFTNGEYKRVGADHNVTGYWLGGYFSDEDGNVMGAILSEGMTFYWIRFEDNGAVHFEEHTSVEFDYMLYEAIKELESFYLPGTDTLLTPITPLIELQTEIGAKVRQRLEFAGTLTRTITNTQHRLAGGFPGCG